ncbi:MAG TPA: alpha-amylase family glycosyl hydrolase [Candidatus Rifleibacterium sp.]|nr:alpha-amylase family glycosyl hydrolase [Candidatus Rifleibacterium sp.]HPT47634.1 alpha-amylase family glycosyl hydrolase [Candidatus Rifleibacterium sp.]
MTETVSNPIAAVKKQLKELAARPFKATYKVPALWVETGRQPEDGKPPVSVHPGEFYLKHLEAIEKHSIKGIEPLRSLNSQLAGGDGGNWINREAIYNIFVRLTAAYDHNGDGSLGGAKGDLTLNVDGIRESGTFLKAIAMLGYIKAIGCTTIHLLPVTAIGHDGNKGELGSPYAIRNPYKLEETQADPLIGLGVEDQFRAFIQACHLLGIRVICEFVFRTASKDSDWIAEHPEWFYWIDEKINDRTPGETDPVKVAAQYGNPVFTADELKTINAKVTAGDLNELPPPHADYCGFFKLPPAKETVKFNAAKQYRGQGTDARTGKSCSVRIPGAFADWPPDDNQPPWGDVTYLRMYNDETPQQPDFNYIAYNTIRMYDRRLARPELANMPLWQTIIDLVPFYQQKYGIDGVMVDMGHAVPVNLMQQLISKARSIDPDFALLSENFEIKQESVNAGYNAVVGYAWWVEYRREGMYDLLNHVGNQGVPLAFFGAVENHNTPRAAGRTGGESYSKYAFLVNTMLPRAIPFIHSGQELGETIPVNTGLDFSNSDLEKLKGKKLALFDLCSYNWDGRHQMFDFICKVLQLRRQYAGAVQQTGNDSFCMVQTGQADVIAFIRRGEGQHLMVLFNRDLQNSLAGVVGLEWCLSGDYQHLDNLVGEGKEKKFKVEQQKLQYKLKPGQCCVFAW